MCTNQEYVLTRVHIATVTLCTSACVAFTTGDVLKVKTSRIVAGQECERTNEFLQVLAGAILSKLDSTEAVQRVLRGEKPSEALGKDKRKQKYVESRPLEIIIRLLQIMVDIKQRYVHTYVVQLAWYVHAYIS